MNAPTDPTVTLYAALVEAQRLARGVEKTSTNQFHRYNYAGAESIILEAKDVLATTGLAILPVGVRVFDLGMRVEPADDKNKTPLREVPQTYRATKWLLVHKAGGTLALEEQVWPVVPEKGRPLDKANASADTAALGYLLRNVLQLARVEEGTDLDHPSRDEHNGNGNGATSSPSAPPAPRAQAAKDAVGAATAKNGNGKKASELILDHVDAIDAATTSKGLMDVIEKRPKNLSTDKSVAEAWDKALEVYEVLQHTRLAGEPAGDLSDDERAALKKIDDLRAARRPAAA